MGENGSLADFFFFRDFGSLDFSTTFSSRHLFKKDILLSISGGSVYRFVSWKNQTLKQHPKVPPHFGVVSFGATARFLGNISIFTPSPKWQQVAGLFHISRVHWLGNSSYQAVGWPMCWIRVWPLAVGYWKKWVISSYANPKTNIEFSPENQFVWHGP